MLLNKFSLRRKTFLTPFLSLGVPVSKQRPIANHQEQTTVSHKYSTKDEQYYEYLIQQQIKLQQALLKQQQYKQEQFSNNGK